MNQLDVRIQHRYEGGFAINVVFRTSSLVTALYGPSGSGKTSILEVVSGLKLPQIGRVELGGRVLLDTQAGVNVPPQFRAVGMVFQEQFLFPHFSVKRNLNFGKKRRHRGNSPIDFERVVEVLELGPALERFPRNLSGGEKQRVALGRALLSGPDLLLLDEPLTGLDDLLKERVTSYIRKAIAEWKIPTLLVSHNLGEVRRLAERVVVLRDGGVVGEGDSADVGRDREIDSPEQDLADRFLAPENHEC